jgi:regulation of enolase protein 1 (concanavalin A-like superfamily)
MTAVPSIAQSKVTAARTVLSRDDGVWLNAPRRWQADANGDLALTTDRATDFWRETHYGFTRNSGHFLGFPTPAAFTAQLRIRGDYQKLYDQAGIMIRLDERRWIKAGIELSDGRAMLSSVLTEGRSDWATSPYADDPRDFWMRATVTNGVLRLQVSKDGTVWPLVRLAPFPVASSYWVGPMACTPEREGLDVRFSELSITPPLDRTLHDLS